MNQVHDSQIQIYGPYQRSLLEYNHTRPEPHHNKASGQPPKIALQECMTLNIILPDPPQCAVKPGDG